MSVCVCVCVCVYYIRNAWGEHKARQRRVCKRGSTLPVKLFLKLKTMIWGKITTTNKRVGKYKFHWAKNKDCWWKWTCQSFQLSYPPVSATRPPICAIDKQFFSTVCVVQFSSVAQLCPSLCDPMDCSTPGLPVCQQLPEPTQTHVHWVSNAIQPSHPLLSPSSPAFNLSQHQGLFKWVSSSYQVAKILEFQLQHQSFQWIFRTDLL